MPSKPPTIILAPIRGVTNSIYRNAIAKTFGGIDSAVAPYITTNSQGTLNIRQLADVHPDANLLPTTGQVLTKNAQEFLHVAQIYCEQGMQEVNLNMGCPYPMVANRGKGSGLLTSPKETKALLTDITKKSPLPVSIKLRLGRHSSSELELLIPIINNLNLHSITIHPRIGDQLYKGSVDLKNFNYYLPLFEKVPYYNGDIFTVNDFQKMTKLYPTIIQWMLGRGVLCNPALPSQIKGKIYSVQEYKTHLQQMHSQIRDGFLNLENGKSDFLNKMREQWSYLSYCFESQHKIFKKIKKARSIDHYNDAVQWIFEQEIAQKSLNG